MSGWLENVRAQSLEVTPIYYSTRCRSGVRLITIVAGYKELSLVQQIKAAGGPDKWREQVLAAQSQQPQGGNGRSNSPQGSIVKLPPSMSRLPASQVAGDDDSTDMSDAALFRHAVCAELVIDREKPPAQSGRVFLLGGCQREG